MDGITVTNLTRDGEWSPDTVPKGQNKGDGKKGDGKKGDGKTFTYTGTPFYGKTGDGKKGDGKKGGGSTSAPASSAPASSASDTAGKASTGEKQQEPDNKKRGRDDSNKGTGKRAKKPIENLNDIDESLKHQYRKCKECGLYDHWRRMRFFKLLDDQTGEYGDYVYTCINCHCKEKNLTKGEARRDIKQERTQKGIARSRAYQQARKHILEDWNFLFVCADDNETQDSASVAESTVSTATDMTEKPFGTIRFTSEGQKKRLVRQAAMVKVHTMKDIMKPMAHILALKALDMEDAVKAARKLQKFLRGEPDNDDEKDADRADELEEDFEVKLYKERAFESYQGIDRQHMKNAADYSDQWFKDARGVQFNVYYMCRAGPALWPCNTVIESQAWDRLHQSAYACKQRWYCGMCNAKYKTRYGVMVEIMLVQDGKQVAMYALGELPPFDLQDAKLMKIEQDFTEYKTPEDLLNALPKVAPMDKATFIKPTGVPGHYSVDDHMFAQLPKFEWNQMYNLGPVKQIDAAEASDGEISV